jgi:hypothetical protein
MRSFGVGKCAGNPLPFGQANLRGKHVVSRSGHDFGDRCQGVGLDPRAVVGTDHAQPVGQMLGQFPDCRVAVTAVLGLP